MGRGRTRLNSLAFDGALREPIAFIISKCRRQLLLRCAISVELVPGPAEALLQENLVAP